jgi:hypothetical protein
VSVETIQWAKLLEQLSRQTESLARIEQHLATIANTTEHLLAAELRREKRGVIIR